MLTLEELKKWFEDIWNIIVDLHISINNYERLEIDKYEWEEQIKKHGFFQHHRYQLRFIMIIQLAKLLDKATNQKRNFHLLGNRLINDEYDSAIKKLLRSNSETGSSYLFRSRKEIKLGIEVLKSRLKEHDSLILKIKLARDKIYAHHDPNVNIELVTFNELKKLVLLSSEIFNYLSSGFFNRESIFNETSDWAVEFILKEVSENRKALMDKFKRDINFS